MLKFTRGVLGRVYDVTKDDTSEPAGRFIAGREGDYPNEFCLYDESELEDEFDAGVDEYASEMGAEGDE